MSTMNQLIKSGRLKKKKHKLTPRLTKCPQKKGTVKRCRINTPRKPNSARRPVAKVMLVSKIRLTAHIPGSGNNLRPYSQVLVRGGGARDLPGVNYSCIRNVYDLEPVHGKTRRRSIYGVALAEEDKKKQRKKLRNL